MDGFGAETGCVRVAMRDGRRSLAHFCGERRDQTFCEGLVLNKR